MLKMLRKVWTRGSLLPAEGFIFGRPLVVLQSDDWGRAGVKDREGWEALLALGLNLGDVIMISIVWRQRRMLKRSSKC
jgi:hypothetical protein